MKKNRNKNFDEVLEDEFGNLFIRSEEKESKDIKAISTGSISLDVSIGVGGIPLKRFTEIFGSESTGKTTLALNICKKFLELGYKVLYIDAEGGLDFKYIKSVVGNFFVEENFKLLQPELMEQSLRIAEIAIQSKEFGLIVLDSIGSLAPKKVKDDDLTDDNVALLARRMTTFLQRNVYDLHNSDTAFVGINQVRSKIGSYMGGYETPGGWAWKHICSLRIQLNKGSDIVVSDEKIGINTRFVIKKNKIAPPFRTFTMPIIFGEGVDELRDLVEYTTMLGILKRGGPYYKFEDEVLGIGMVKTMDYLRENPETLDKIKEMCYNSVNNIYSNEDNDVDELVSEIKEVIENKEA